MKNIIIMKYNFIIAIFNVLCSLFTSSLIEFERSPASFVAKSVYNTNLSCCQLLNSETPPVLGQHIGLLLVFVISTLTPRETNSHLMFSTVGSKSVQILRQCLIHLYWLTKSISLEGHLR